MPSPRFPIPQGTLDMLILQILSLEPAHGYGIAQRLEQISRSVVQVNQGSLYPALHRLQQKGWLRAEWKQTVLSIFLRTTTCPAPGLQNGDPRGTVSA